MSFPLFRFTLSNDTAGTLVISEPGGWDEAKLKLERNKEFHSLVEFYDQPLTFYGDDISHDGGIQYIRTIEQTQGIDAQISLLIELSQDEGDTYDVVFEGLLSIETAKEIDFYKLEMGVLRNGFWQKFINRKATPIDLSATLDLDGGTRMAIDPITLRLPSQAIRSVFKSKAPESNDPERVPIEYNFNNLAFIFYGVVDLPVILQNSIQESFLSYPATLSDFPPPSFVARFRGIYTFTIQIHVSTVPYGVPFCCGDRIPFGVIRLLKNGVTHTNSTRTDLGTNGIDGRSRYNIAVTMDLEVGDEISFYYFVVGVYTIYVVYDGWFPGEPSFIEVTADTVYEDTETPAFFIKDAAESIISKCIGRDNVLNSDHLDSCYGLYSIMNGLNLRGYSLAEKPITLSFDNWWKGIDPILNLGLVYEQTSPETIRIEQKSYFYDKTISINFDFVNNIERSYDLDSVFKLIEIGYSKWSAESASGIDDPQTKRTYNTRFKTVGKEITILSQFIAASLAIEQTRRNRVETGKDWRLDNDVFIIALKETSPYEPELDENFSAISNLLNSNTRYNIRLSVARNFERWKSYFNGCLQWYMDDYKFASGEGNYDMATTLVDGDCEALAISPEPSLSEKQDIAVKSDYLFKPIKYSFVHPMTWDDYKTIRDNPTKAIGISRTDANHVACHIEVLEYEITHGKGTFEIYLSDNDYL